jgi:glycosyltransferase involved in cell wall biosynthesis
LGIPKERQSQLSQLKPKLDSNHLIFISTGPGGWRTHYKGLDLMIKVFDSIHLVKPELQFTIVGEWDINLQEQLLSGCSNSSRKAINFIGQTNEIAKSLEKASFYFHISRGDAFPTAVLEAMCAGLIPLVSEWTGSKEIVREIDPELITTLEHEDVKNRLVKLIEMDLNKRQEYAQKARSLAMKFSEEFALDHYRKTFEQIEQELY